MTQPDTRHLLNNLYDYDNYVEKRKIPAQKQASIAECFKR